jgi:hypothetical protein
MVCLYIVKEQDNIISLVDCMFRLDDLAHSCFLLLKVIIFDNNTHIGHFRTLLERISN